MAASPSSHRPTVQSTEPYASAQCVCRTRGFPSLGSSTDSATSAVHSTARPYSPARSHADNIEQKLLPAIMRSTSPAVIVAIASSSRSNPSRMRPCETSASPLSASARTSRSQSPNSIARARARAALRSSSSTSGTSHAISDSSRYPRSTHGPDLIDQPHASGDPAARRSLVAEEIAVHPGDLGGHASRRAQVPGFPEVLERDLEMMARAQ